MLARLQTSDVDPAQEGMDASQQVVRKLRRAGPKTRIIIRGDSGFSNNELMDFCETTPLVDYIFGQAKNSRLEKLIDTEMAEAKAAFEETDETSKVYSEFQYQTRNSWSRKRRIIAKAEDIKKGANPRFLVTSLTTLKYGKVPPRVLYEKLYCARGDMENRLKEQQLGLFAERTSTPYIKSNQVRLFFSSIASTLLRAMREYGLKGTKLAKAQCWTIRNRLLKVAVQVRFSVRRIKRSFPTAYIEKNTMFQILKQVQTIPLRI